MVKGLPPELYILKYTSTLQYITSSSRGFTQMGAIKPIRRNGTKFEFIFLLLNLLHHLLGLARIASITESGRSGESRT